MRLKTMRSARRTLAISRVLAIICRASRGPRPPAKQRTAPTRRCSTTVAEDTIQKMERDGFAVLETTLLTPHRFPDEAREFVPQRATLTLIEAASKRGADLDRLDFYEIASRNPGRLTCGWMKRILLDKNNLTTR